MVKRRRCCCIAPGCEACPSSITADLTSVFLTDNNCDSCGDIPASWVLGYRGNCIWNAEIFPNCFGDYTRVAYFIETPLGVRTHWLRASILGGGFNQWIAEYKLADSSTCPLSSLDFFQAYTLSGLGINYACNNWDGATVVWPATVSIT